MKRRYLDGRFGQIHVRENSARAGTPLVCLHATAYSSRSFEALGDALEGRRHVVAPDTPGYGESDPPPEPTDIAGYADAIAEMLPDEADLFGYHTGVSIAVEIALRHPARIRRIVVMGIPYFRALDFDHWKAVLTKRHSLENGLGQFAERWDYLVTNRPAGVSLERGFGNFVDELKAWPNGSWAHDALFEHDLDVRLPLVTQPVLVLNAGGHLAAPSRLAARLIPGAMVSELPIAEGTPLDFQAAPIADRLIEFLGAEDPVIPIAAGSRRP